MIRLCYPTQNLTIPAGNNRTRRLANLHDAGKVRGLIRENLASLQTILRWHAEHGIPLFRMGQSLIPFASHSQFPYDWAEEHGDELRQSGELARALGIRLSMHPGQYIQPGSLKPEVVERSLAELRAAARILDLIGTPDSVLVLHMGGGYKDKPATAARFVETMRPEEGVLEYLALENDERVWTVVEVAKTARALNIPAITYTLHPDLGEPGGASQAPPLQPGPRKARRRPCLLGGSRGLAGAPRRSREQGGRGDDPGEGQGTRARPDGYKV